ncbi:MAG TPA: hypothetical protein VLF16_15700 [Pseudomonas sp.]|nr:hypothetical protein [Pseudomonas sp.]
MILGERTEFADNLSLNTGAAGTYNLGDQIDTGPNQRDLGVGNDLVLVIQASEDITAGSAGTVSLQLVSDSTPTPATDGSQTIHARTASFATSTTPIKAGTVLATMALPLEGGAYERYLGIQQVTGTAAITAGKINAFLTPLVAKIRHYVSPFHGA